MSGRDDKIRDKIAQNDVTMARSYLEVDMMEWFSNEEVPFAYEAFVIPSIAGPGKEEWDSMVDAIRAIGDDRFSDFDEAIEGTRMDGMRPVELLSMWTDIHDKHRLKSQHVYVDIKPSLSRFSKRMILPDFALYMDYDRRVAEDYFDWSSWDYIIEVSGLWGVGLPGEATESDWWDWYRVGAVAFKELAYKLLGIWEDVYWVIPYQPDIPGQGGGIPSGIMEDDHYVIARVTQSDLGLDVLADKIGITTDGLDAKLSPPIEPAEYERPSQGYDEEMKKRVYKHEGINIDAINSNPDAVLVGEGVMMFHGDLGEVYITGDSCYVRESQWRRSNMILLREYVLSVLRELSSDDGGGIVEGLEEV